MKAALRELAPAKINLALHVRGRLPDGRHRIETLFAFCTDGDMLAGELADEFALEVGGPFGPNLDPSQPNLVEMATRKLGEQVSIEPKVHLLLDKRLPVASGIGGGSADAAAALRLLTRLWGIDPKHASAVAPQLGSDVPACLLSMTARGDGAGDALKLVEDGSICGTPVLLVNPGQPLATREVFAGWDGVDRGPLVDWRHGRNDLEAPALGLVPAIGDVLEWLADCPGVDVAHMSGSGATCFGLFETEAARDDAATTIPQHWWHMASVLR